MTNGIDIFDSSFAVSATDKGHALAYNIGSAIYKLQKHKKLADQSGEEHVEVVDLNSTEFAADFRPLISGCGCYTCVTHTRAYLHHLLVTKELLAGILLAM